MPCSCLVGWDHGASNHPAWRLLPSSFSTWFKAAWRRPTGHFLNSWKQAVGKYTNKYRSLTQTKVDIVEGSKLSTTQQLNIAAGQIEIIKSSIQIPLGQLLEWIYGWHPYLLILESNCRIFLSRWSLNLQCLSLPEYRNRLILSSSFSSRNGWPAWTCWNHLPQENAKFTLVHWSSIKVAA